VTGLFSQSRNDAPALQARPEFRGPLSKAWMLATKQRLRFVPLEQREGIAVDLSFQS
jgi:hypothetical protein